MIFHEKIMRRCLQLASLGKPTVSPNPMVGSVITLDNTIIGEGWHYKAGQAHAEINAINSVKDKELLKKATLYVNLEPCSHFGRTPPCSDAIIKYNIPRVVIGCRDQSSKVNGKGIENLRNAGIEVLEGILEEECIELNRRFLVSNIKKRPYILLKWAQSQDGFMDIDRSTNDQGIFWISHPDSKSMVHKLRVSEDAILIGANTLINDQPLLNSRFYSGKDPKIIVLANKDKDLKTDSKIDFKLIQNSNANLLLKELFKYCQKEDIHSILVEGGKSTLELFIDSNQYDEIYIIEAKYSLNTGIKAPTLTLDHAKYTKLGVDKLIHIRNI